jgi:hypothetical protein
MDMKLTAKQRHAKPTTMRQALRGAITRGKGKNFEED